MNAVFLRHKRLAFCAGYTNHDPYFKYNLKHVILFYTYPEALTRISPILIHKKKTVMPKHVVSFLMSITLLKMSDLLPFPIVTACFWAGF